MKKLIAGTRVEFAREDGTKTDGIVVKTILGYGYAVMTFAGRKRLPASAVSPIYDR